MKTILSKGSASLTLNLPDETVYTFVNAIKNNPGLVVTFGDAATEVKRFVTITVYGYEPGYQPDHITLQKIPAIKAIRNATNMGLTEAKQAVEYRNGKRLVVPTDLAWNLVMDLRRFGYSAHQD